MSASVQVPPDLFLLLSEPDPAHAGAGVAPAARQRLARWLGRGEAGPMPEALPRDQAARLAGQQLPVPWAALWTRAQARRSGPPAAGEQFLWLEPVRMAAGMNSVRMAPPASPIDGRSLRSIANLLQPVLNDAGVRIETAGGRLLARCEPPLDVRCVPPEAAFSGELRDCLPQGPDAGRLRRLLTECQMVLHQAAENGTGVAGDINGVWAWGEGLIGSARSPSAVTARVYSSDPLLLALDSALADVGSGRRSTDAGAGTSGAARLLTALAQLDDTRRLIWVGGAGDRDLDELLAKAETALRSGRLARIELGYWPAPGTAAPARVVSLRRRSLWRWWRKPDSPWETPP